MVPERGEAIVNNTRNKSLVGYGVNDAPGENCGRTPLAYIPGGPCAIESARNANQ